MDQYYMVNLKHEGEYVTVYLYLSDLTLELDCDYEGDFYIDIPTMLSLICYAEDHFSTGQEFKIFHDIARYKSNTPWKVQSKCTDRTITFWVQKLEYADEVSGYVPVDGQKIESSYDGMINLKDIIMQEVLFLPDLKEILEFMQKDDTGLFNLNNINKDLIHEVLTGNDSGVRKLLNLHPSEIPTEYRFFDIESMKSAGYSIPDGFSLED